MGICRSDDRSKGIHIHHFISFTQTSSETAGLWLLYSSGNWGTVQQEDKTGDQLITSPSGWNYPQKELLLLGNFPECLFQEESLTEGCISAFLKALELWGHEERLASPGFSHKHHADSLSLYLGQPCISNWRVTRLQFTRELLKIPMGQKDASVIGPLPATQPVGITGIHGWICCQHFYFLFGESSYSQA